VKALANGSQRNEREMHMDKKTPSSRKYNVQLITDGERWPFVGRALVRFYAPATANPRRVEHLKDLRP
jgi:hypothetical protein